MDENNHVGDIQHLSEVTHHGDSVMQNSNGYTSTGYTIAADAEDDDGERAGVFDYMPQNHLPRNESRFGCTQNCNEPEDLRQESLRRKWANDTAYNSNVECLSSKELITFRSSSRSAHSIGCSSDLKDNLHVLNGADLPDVATTPDDSLEEIVIQTEVVPQRASYERFGAERGSRYRPANNTAPVYITNIQRSGEHKDAYWNYGDEREVVERRSSQNRQYANASMREQYFGSSDNPDELTHLLPVSAAANGPDSPVSAASGGNDDSTSTTSAVTRPFSSMIYLNDIPMWARTAGGLVSSSDVTQDDGSSSSRYYSSNGSRSDTARRLRTKLEKKRSNQVTNGTDVGRALDSSDQTDDKSVEELLAYINNMKVGEAPKMRPTTVSSKSSGKDKGSVRRKKKQLLASDDTNTDGSDITSARASDDRSMSSGSEAPDHPIKSTSVLTPFKCVVSSKEVVLQPSNVMADPSSDDLGVVQPDHDQFVVVQKKKKTKSNAAFVMHNRLSNAEVGRQHFKKYIPSFGAVRSAFVNPNDSALPMDTNASVLPRHHSEADSRSWTSDSESTSSSLVREQGTTNGIHLCGNDFPDLHVDRSSVVSARRNSTGNAIGVENVVKTVATQSFTTTTSYAIVAAVGLSSCAIDSQEHRISLEQQTAGVVVGVDSVNGVGSNTSISTSCDVSSSYISAAALGDPSVSNSSAESTSESGISVVSPVQITSVNTSAIDRKFNERRVPVGPSKNSVLPICTVNPESNSADTSVSSDAVKRMNLGVHNVSSNEQPVQAQTTVVFSTSSRTSCVSEKKLKCPVVFMDVGSDSVGQSSSSTGSIGISFGFDDADTSSTIPVSVDRKTSQVPISASCVIPTCARCTVYSTDKVSSNATTSTDSATSPIEQNDFICGVHGKSGVMGWSSTSHHVSGYCRSHSICAPSHSTANPPVGIVPPIQHIDRTQVTDAIDNVDPKLLLSERTKPAEECLADETRKCSLSDDIQFISESSTMPCVIKPTLSSVQNQHASCTMAASETRGCNKEQTVGSFCLLSAQIFLYKGFEDTLSEQSQSPDRVHQFVIDV